MIFSGYTADTNAPHINKGDSKVLTIKIYIADNKKPDFFNTYTIKLTVNNVNRVPVIKP